MSRRGGNERKLIYRRDEGLRLFLGVLDEVVDSQTPRSLCSAKSRRARTNGAPAPRFSKTLVKCTELTSEITDGSFYTGKYPEAGQAKEAKTLMKPEGEWNTFRIQAKGNTFTCWINGQKASEYTDPKFSGPAPIGLQIHPGVVMKCEYRNILFTTL